MMKHILAISMECWNVNLFEGNSKQNLILTQIGKCPGIPRIHETRNKYGGYS